MQEGEGQKVIGVCRVVHQSDVNRNSGNVSLEALDVRL